MSWMKKSKHLCNLLVIPFCAFASTAYASDHGDHHGFENIKTKSGKLADFYMFSKDDKLTLVATISIAKDHKLYWDESVRYRFALDYSSKVDCAYFVDVSQGPSVKAPCNLEISKPSKILEDVFIDLKISGSGADLRSYGLKDSASVRYSYGLFDDPFIRKGVIGRNVRAIIVEIPLSDIPAHGGSGHLLGWVTSFHNTLNVPLDHIGHPYASQDNTDLNSLHPSLHVTRASRAPDVLILDTTKPTAYPNGRALEDDVVDILGKTPRIPNPSENDKKFQSNFPYLSSPH